MNYRISIQSLAIISLLGCHSYTPMPVDLDEHLAAFEHRTPTVPSDGALTRAVARELAKMFHPDARLARRRAGAGELRHEGLAREQQELRHGQSWQQGSEREETDHLTPLRCFVVRVESVGWFGVVTCS